MESTSQVQTALQFYSCPGILSDAGEYAALFNELPDDVGLLCKTIQGLMVHIFWTSRYGLSLPEERQAEVQLRSMPLKLNRLFELDERPLSELRPLEKRLVGNCRDFSLFLASILQHKGIPARARCGFGTYFRPDHFEDHWVCEYWNAQDGRWVMVDAQLDGFQCEKLKINFNPLDLSPAAFVTGGKAWQMCRAGTHNPDQFGIFDMKGLWFVEGDMIRDFLALNKIEILPWDPWGYITGPEIPETDLPALDRIAELTVAGDDVFSDLRQLFATDSRLQPAADWMP